MVRRGVTSIVLLTLAAAAWAGAATAAPPPAHIATEITIAYDLVNDRDELSGVVNADDIPACVAREIKIFRRKSGPDQLLARTTSSRTKYGYGLWGIARDHLRHGKYYAVAARKRGRDASGDAVLCAAAGSDRIAAP